MRRTFALCAAALAAACSPASAATLGEALNATNLTWTTGGTAAWVAQSTTTHDGLWAARSGAISDNSETWMETTVTGPGLLSFWWKVSSESDYDYLEFYINGVRQAAPISGEVDWQVQNYTLGTGAQVLRWRYMKDGATSSGRDRDWVDQVSFASASGPPVILVQPGSLYKDVGTTASFSVMAGGAPPLSFQWRFNGANLPNATNAMLTVNLITVDSGFNPEADNGVGSLAVQPDGKILVGGWFTTLGGQTRNYIGRLNADGTVDSGFNPAAENAVRSLAVQTDGKILVGGDFTALGGQTRNSIGRLNADGTLDSEFNPGVAGGQGVAVLSLAVQADGKVLVHGEFNRLVGQARHHLGRLKCRGDTGQRVWAAA